VKTRSRLLALALSLTTQAAAAISRGPYLQAGTTTSMTICWALDEERPCVLEYGTTPRYGTRVPSQTPTGHPRSRLHFARLTGLKPGTRYYYRIVCEGRSLTADLPQLSFTTHPASATRPWSFVVIGDSGTRSRDQLLLAALIPRLVPAPDFGLHMGDVTQSLGEDETEYDWCFFSVYGETLRRIPIYCARGNHDGARMTPWPLDPLALRIGGRKPTARDHPVWQVPFFNVFHTHANNDYHTPAPWFFDYANARFVCGDPDTLHRDLLEFVPSALAKSGKRWHFFISHWSAGELYDREMSKVPRIDVTLEGHRHYYYRSAPRGPYQTVSFLIGASGADVKPDYLADKVTEQNPNGLSDNVRWAEKAPHIAHFIINGDRLTMRLYYPDGIVADWLEIELRDGKKHFREMPLEVHPRRPLWQRALTPAQKRFWVDKNAKWKVLARDKKGRVTADRYVGHEPLARLPELPGGLTPSPADRPLASFYPRHPRYRLRLTTAAEFDWALRELASQHYVLNLRRYAGGTDYFEVRFLELLGDAPRDPLVQWLLAAARQSERPLYQRLIAVVALGKVASETADQALLALATEPNLDVASSAWAVLARLRGDCRGLLAMAHWLEANASNKLRAREVSELARRALPTLVPCGPKSKNPHDWASFLRSNATNLLFDKRRATWPRLRAAANAPR